MHCHRSGSRQRQQLNAHSIPDPMQYPRHRPMLHHPDMSRPSLMRLPWKLPQRLPLPLQKHLQLLPLHLLLPLRPHSTGLHHSLTEMQHHPAGLSLEAQLRLHMADLKLLSSAAAATSALWRLQVKSQHPQPPSLAQCKAPAQHLSPRQLHGKLSPLGRLLPIPCKPLGRLRQIPCSPLGSNPLLSDLWEVRLAWEGP